MGKEPKAHDTNGITVIHPSSDVAVPLGGVVGVFCKEARSWYHRPGAPSLAMFASAVFFMCRYAYDDGPATATTTPADWVALIVGGLSLAAAAIVALATITMTPRGQERALLDVAEDQGQNNSQRIHRLRRVRLTALATQAATWLISVPILLVSTAI